MLMLIVKWEMENAMNLHFLLPAFTCPAGHEHPASLSVMNTLLMSTASRQTATKSCWLFIFDELTSFTGTKSEKWFIIYVQNYYYCFVLFFRAEIKQIKTGQKVCRNTKNRPTKPNRLFGPFPTIWKNFYSYNIN